MKTLACFFRIQTPFLLVAALMLRPSFATAKPATSLVSSVSRFTILSDSSYREESGGLYRNGEYRAVRSETGPLFQGDKVALEPINGRAVMSSIQFGLYQSAGLIPTWVTHSVATYHFGIWDYVILSYQGGPDPNPLPVFTDNPTSVTIVNGDSLNLWGTAEPDSQVSYQWLKNGKPMPGQTEFSLYISECAKADSGKYTLRASIGSAVADSAPATIKIVNPVIIRRDLKDVSVKRGRTFTLSISARGNRPVRYQWYHDYAPIPGATSSRLVLRPVKDADAGDYYVDVSDDFSSAESREMTLTVTP